MPPRVDLARAGSLPSAMSTMSMGTRRTPPRPRGRARTPGLAWPSHPPNVTTATPGSLSSSREDGRADEGDGLENSWSGLTGLVGSIPLLPAAGQPQLKKICSACDGRPVISGGSRSPTGGGPMSAPRRPRDRRVDIRREAPFLFVQGSAPHPAAAATLPASSAHAGIGAASAGVAEVRRHRPLGRDRRSWRLPDGAEDAAEDPGARGSGAIREAVDPVSRRRSRRPAPGRTRGCPRRPGPRRCSRRGTRAPRPTWRPRSRGRP